MFSNDIKFDVCLVLEPVKWLSIHALINDKKIFPEFYGSSCHHLKHEGNY